MNKLSFKFIPEHRHLLGKKEDGDVIVTVLDQIQVFIDDKNDDLDYGFGMFPFDFFSQDKHFYNGKLQIGICGCSCYQCGDVSVDVNSTDDTVTWSTKVWSKKDRKYIDGKKYHFNKNEYSEIINQYKNEYLPEELLLKVKNIIFEEIKSIEIKEDFKYHMFRFYDNRQDIIIYFIKDDVEKKYFIGWNESFDTLKEEISKFDAEKLI